MEPSEGSDTVPGARGGPEPVEHEKSAGAAPALDRRLQGSLPCIGCAYELRGLSVRAVCPECGTPVRGSILALVDPAASELRPIRRPRLLAAALIAWVWAALAATFLMWLPHADHVIAVVFDLRPVLPAVGPLAAVLLAISTLGAAILVRPHAGLPTRAIHFARAGLACQVLAAFVTAVILLELDAPRPAEYFADWSPPLERTLLRLLAGAATLGVLLGFRPNATALVDRSLALRQGRVDRQKLTALAAAVAVAMLGDLIVLGSEIDAARGGLQVSLRLSGQIVIALGSSLWTLGLLSAGFDAARIATAIRKPPRSLPQVLGGPENPPRRADNPPPEPRSTP